VWSVMREAWSVNRGAGRVKRGPPTPLSARQRAGIGPGVRGTAGDMTRAALSDFGLPPPAPRTTPLCPAMPREDLSHFIFHLPPTPARFRISDLFCGLALGTCLWFELGHPTETSKTSKSANAIRAVTLPVIARQARTRTPPCPTIKIRLRADTLISIRRSKGWQ
jgi:hypothetical protein